MSQIHHKLIRGIILMTGAAVLLKFGAVRFLDVNFPAYLRLIAGLFILLFGAVYPLSRSAEIIEAATEVLSKKTHLSSGLLQSFGTAFPDMVLGVTAAVVSLSLVRSDPVRAISYAMIAASTTFGSNVYNIGHATWCIWRQNRADKLNKTLQMFPYIKSSGFVKPLNEHKHKPYILELDTAVRILTVLTVLTASVALAMVAFGRVSSTTFIGGDLYQLIRPAGITLLFVTLAVLIKFRRDAKEVPEAEAAESSTPLGLVGLPFVWLALVAAGITIAFTAESMVRALEIVSSVAHIPYVVTGTLAGIIGCLGEMMVIHNYTIHQNGRIGDAVVGVAMDNIVTIMGASVVAVMGGIFLGGTSLIVLFVLILTLNTILIDQISLLKNTIFRAKGV